jgi:hypothetical protein
VSGDKVAAARALLEARAELLQAQNTALRAEEVYRAAESAYFEACKAQGDETPYSDYPKNLLLDGMVIMPVEEWYDLAPGKRLTFHTVEVAS